MATQNSIFMKEFRDMMNGRRNLSGALKLVDIPVPSISTMLSGAPKRVRAIVKGIKEPFFERLNGHEVELTGRMSLQKREVVSDGTFRKDGNGNFVTVHVPVPHNCVAIISHVPIGLKRKVEGREHKVSEGYKYVDYITTAEGRKYVYIVPKDFVYRLTMCALIITANKRRNYYKGAKIARQTGSYFYLYVVPYTYRENMDARILGVKSGFSFDNEVSQILSYWVQQGVMFHPTLTAISDTQSKVQNLGIMNLEGTILSEDFKRYSVSLAQDKEEMIFPD